MITSEQIADKIEEVIGRMFSEFQSFEPSASEYSIFFDPQRHATWFILLFFSDISQLREGLRNGTCFQIYSFVVSELNKVEELSSVDRAIFFESGNRPTEKNDIDDLFGKLLKKTAGLAKNAGKADVKVCGSCGHDFDKHQMFCYKNQSGKIDMTTKGWMICPEENCNCFLTWGVNENYQQKSNE